MADPAKSAVSRVDLAEVENPWSDERVDQVVRRHAASLQGKLLESETLRKQATSNSQEEFAGSPDIDHEMTIASINTMDAHQTKSMQVLYSPNVQRAIVDLLFGPLKLWERLRELSQTLA